jgi:hypothetical protein
MNDIWRSNCVPRQTRYNDICFIEVIQCSK